MANIIGKLCSALNTNNGVRLVLHSVVRKLDDLFCFSMTLKSHDDFYHDKNLLIMNGIRDTLFLTIV